MIEFVIENSRLVLKSNDTDWQRDATPEEYSAFVFGLRKGQELIALKVADNIRDIEIKIPIIHPLANQ